MPHIETMYQELSSSDKAILSLGSYKISEKLLFKLMRKDFTKKDGSVVKGASSYEIDAVLYFSQICDNKGFIPRFKITSLTYLIGCSERECYQLLDSLAEKGIITVVTKAKNGYRDIILLDNDFSGKNKLDFKKNRYLNTNRDIFNCQNYSYRYYSHLSLFAKKLFLLMSFEHTKKYGYRADISHLAKRLGIKNPAHIKDYVEEIAKLDIDNGILLHDSKGSGGKKSLLYANKNCTIFVPSQGIQASMPSCLKYKLSSFLDEFQIKLLSSGDPLFRKDALKLTKEEEINLVHKTASYIITLSALIKDKVTQSTKSVLKDLKQFISFQGIFSFDLLETFFTQQMALYRQTYGSDIIAF